MTHLAFSCFLFLSVSSGVQHTTAAPFYQIMDSNYSQDKGMNDERKCNDTKTKTVPLSDRCEFTPNLNQTTILTLTTIYEYIQICVKTLKLER